MVTSGARCFSVTTSSGRTLLASRLRYRTQSDDVLVSATSIVPSPRTRRVTSSSVMPLAATAPATSTRVPPIAGRVFQVVASDHGGAPGVNADGPTLVASALLEP